MAHGGWMGDVDGGWGMWMGGYGARLQMAPSTEGEQMKSFKLSARRASPPMLMAALAVTVSLAACQTPQPREFEFALIGDNPYVAENEPRYLRMIDHINAHDDLAWVVHLGDLKGGAQSCADAALRERFEMNQRIAAPFVFTPGDNDWYDCVREGAGAMDDYERLAYLRQLFFPDPRMTTGGRRMAVETQADTDAHPDFVENVLWVRDGVVFAAVHIIGPTREPTDAEADERLMAAARAWIEAAFARAEAIDARGVFLATQADPWLFSGLPALLSNYCPDCPIERAGLEWLYPLLADATLDFGRPVVLAVGDTHVFRVDKPLYTAGNALVSNFTRVEAFGHPDVHWVRVTCGPTHRLCSRSSSRSCPATWSRRADAMTARSDAPAAISAALTPEYRLPADRWPTRARRRQRCRAATAPGSCSSRRVQFPPPRDRSPGWK